MSRIQEPLTWRKHGKLQDEILDHIIAIQLHHCIQEREDNKKSLEKARSTKAIPTWEETVKVLQAAHAALNNEREDPRKY